MLHQINYDRPNPSFQHQAKNSKNALRRGKSTDHITKRYIVSTRQCNSGTHLEFQIIQDTEKNIRE